MKRFTITVSPSVLNLDHTLGSAQAFTWRKSNGSWRGTVGGKVIAATQLDSVIRFETDLTKDRVKCYFNLVPEHDLELFFREILSTSNDDKVRESFDRFRGLAILKQDPWETIAGFIVSQNSNVKMIEERVARLCDKIDDGAFPSPGQVADSGEKLSACYLGYREKYLRETSKLIANGKINLAEVERMPHEQARGTLMQLPGIGPKVADCICLYAFNQWESFPVDTHIYQALHKWYPGEVSGIKNGKVHLSYDNARAFGRTKFGKYCGYAQQYLFHEHRTNKAAGVNYNEVFPSTT